MAKNQRAIEHVGSVSGFRDGLEEVLEHDITVRVSDAAREAIKLIDDAKADMYARHRIGSGISSNSFGVRYRRPVLDPEYR